MTDTTPAAPALPLAPAAHPSVHVISAIVTLGFIGFLLILAFHMVEATALMNVMTGILGTSFGSVVQYYLGSSLGDAQKSQHITSMIQSQLNGAKPAE